MLKSQYKLIEEHMLQMTMKDGVHDIEHVNRVLSVALDIASFEKGVNHDVLIASCLLHDISREAEINNPAIDHAVSGAAEAYHYLTYIGFSESFAQRVRACIYTHRYRSDRLPKSIEAKILFDADKLDVTGTMGIARTLMWLGREHLPLYNRAADSTISSGKEDSEISFLQEYHYKLKKLYDLFYTKRGKELAMERQKISEDFYNSLLNELESSFKSNDRIAEYLE